MSQIVAEKLNSKILHTQVTWVNSKKQKYEKNNTDVKMVRPVTCFFGIQNHSQSLKAKFLRQTDVPLFSSIFLLAPF